MSVANQNPYAGPRTFQEDERHLFFGREREARELLQLALTGQDRLVLFYSQSGAGKSSLLNTRLIPDLEARNFEVLPIGRLSGESPMGLKISDIYIFNLIRSLIAREVDVSDLSRLSLLEFLGHLVQTEFGYYYDPEQTSNQKASRTPRRMLIIDQFEELFSTHPEAWQQRDDFFNQLGQALQENPALWVVLAMREDYLASLDPYAHLLPGGLRVRYYMQRLGPEAALQAIKGPVENIRPYAPGVAEKLVDDLRAMRIIVPDGTIDFHPGQHVEPVQLQVVCFGLWDNLSPDGKEITAQDLLEVGDVQESLGRHYQRRVAEVASAKLVKERIIRDWIEHRLIGPGGVRVLVVREQAGKSGGLDDDVIQSLQSDLVRAEVRGGNIFYELTHDRLVEPILANNKRWFEEHSSPWQRQAALWHDQYRNESWLLRDQALIEVEEWATSNLDEITELEVEFLEASRKQQAEFKLNEQARSAQRLRRFVAVVGVLAFIAIVAAVAALWFAVQTQATSEIPNPLIVIAFSIVSMILGYLLGRNRSK